MLHQRTAPGLDDIETLARDAFQRLPETFRARCSDLIIRVQEFPDDDVLRDLEIENPFDLMGLYHGVAHAARESTAPPPDSGPDMIFLYRRPLLDYWAEYDETLGDLVTHLLIHEIGHHFGLSDADMHAIEEQAAEPSGDQT